MILVYAVGFPGIPDLVVWPDSSLNFLIVGKIQDDHHLTR